jgi:hypothetical protein
VVHTRRIVATIFPTITIITITTVIISLHLFNQEKYQSQCSNKYCHLFLNRLYIRKIKYNKFEEFLSFSGAGKGSYRLGFYLNSGEFYGFA